ncbi:hypothetical protein Tco_0752532 [Tanacetum coccineum]|uniref:Uncharacterized protein n=1 Tax=Tanacetum coccineum TaxID=301880 RepID=A0ABQ4Z8T5_9ASTR
MHSKVKVPNDLLVVNAKDLIAKVNRSLADMNELVWFLELYSSWKHHHHMLLLLLRGEKSAQVDALNPKPQKSPFDISDDDQQDIPLNTTTAPTQEEPQSSGTLDDPNSLAMVQLSTQLFGSGPSQFTPTPPSSRADKEKGIAQSTNVDALKMIMTLMEDSQLLITKFNYKANKSTKISTMCITRNSQPLNYKIFEDFRLKMLGFNEWLEFHKLASKKQGAANDQLLKNLKAKFKWVATTAEKLNIPPQHQLTDFELPLAKLKRKRTYFLKEVFVSEDVVVDGMYRNLTPP